MKSAKKPLNWQASMTKAEKATYDRDYRKRNKERLRRQHAEYFQRTYDPVEAAIERKKECRNISNTAARLGIASTSESTTASDERWSMERSRKHTQYFSNSRKKSDSRCRIASSDTSSLDGNNGIPYFKKSGG